MGNTERLTAGDGHRFDAYLARPADGVKAGLVLCQEIFGVNAHIRKVADGFAADGYLVVAPALFDRVERGVELCYAEPDLAKGRELRTSIPWDQVVVDVGAAVEEAAKGGKVGVIGYCWGGSVAWLAACRLPVAAAVGFYGGQIHELRDQQPRCPVMLHFGEKDSIIPMQHVDEIRARHPDVQSYVYPAGHGFSCDERTDYHLESAALARKRTLDFLAEHLG